MNTTSRVLTGVVIVVVGIVLIGFASLRIYKDAVTAEEQVPTYKEKALLISGEDLLQGDAKENFNPDLVEYSKTIQLNTAEILVADYKAEKTNSQQIKTKCSYQRTKYESTAVSFYHSWWLGFSNALKKRKGRSLRPIEGIELGEQSRFFRVLDNGQPELITFQIRDSKIIYYCIISNIEFASSDELKRLIKPKIEKTFSMQSTEE